MFLVHPHSQSAVSSLAPFLPRTLSITAVPGPSNLLTLQISNSLCLDYLLPTRCSGNSYPSIKSWIYPTSLQEPLLLLLADNEQFLGRATEHCPSVIDHNGCL